MDAGMVRAGRRMIARFTSFGREFAGSQLIRSSSLLFISNVLTRALGFGFSIVAAHALGAPGFGLVTYVLALGGITSVLVYNASAGLARALARTSLEPRERNAVFSSYLVVTGCLLLLSILSAIPVGLVAGLPGWSIVGLLGILIGNAGFEMYVELQRGRERFTVVAAYTLLANLIQLVTVVGFFLLVFKEPAAYLLVFGLSSIVALVVAEVVKPTDLRFARAAVDWQRIKEVLRFVLPLLLHTGFFMAWMGADVVFLEAFNGLASVGEYGAAKTFANAMLLAPSAIGTALLPHAARLDVQTRRQYFGRLLLLVTVVTIPPLAILSLLGRTLLGFVYGPSYAAAAGPLLILTIGMAFYGIYLALEESWVAIGRPRLAAGVTAIAAVLTVSTAPFLIIHAGPTGAALSFALGAAAQLIVLCAVTARHMRGQASPANPT